MLKRIGSVILNNDVKDKESKVQIANLKQEIKELKQIMDKFISAISTQNNGVKYGCS